jgi:hypothetical protein
MATPQTPAFSRPVLPPAVFGAMVLLGGLALLDSDAYLYIRFGVSVLALICCVFVNRAQQPWWLVPLVPIVIVWNPVWPLDLHGQLWVAGQFVAALAFIATGLFVKEHDKEQDKRRR